MAQGQIKKSKATQASERFNPPSAKKGQRVIKPKKALAVKKVKATKKYSAGLTAKTERSLAEKAGHLEMLHGGKRERPRSEAKGAKGN